MQIVQLVGIEFPDTQGTGKAVPLACGSFLNFSNVSVRFQSSMLNTYLIHRIFRNSIR